MPADSVESHFAMAGSFISFPHSVQFSSWRSEIECMVIFHMDPGQTREICEKHEKQEKYFKGKVGTFTVQSLLQVTSILLIY